MKVEFDTEKLRSMDLILTTDYLPWSAVIKKAEGAPALSNAATHCFFYVVDESGLCWNIGMGKRPQQQYFKFQTGLEMRDLHESINNANPGTQIVKIIRHPCWDNDSARIAASKFLAYAATSEQWNLFTKDNVWIKYDWPGFFSYLDPQHRIISQDRKRSICSEVPDAIAKRYANCQYTTFPSFSKRPPTPYDLQKTAWPEITDYLVNFWQLTTF
jgi:hypothetical protein